MMNKNEWKKVKLEDVFELQIGRTPSRNNKNYWDNGSNNWISISDIKENEKYIEKTKERITNLAIQDSKIKLVPKNTVIMSFKLSVGKTAITSQDIYTNEAIVAFIPKVLNLVDNNFLYYYLQNINWKDGINKAVKGLTLNKPLISNKIIFLPDLKIQKQIAKKLDTVFSILNLKKQQLLELDKLVKFQFLEMFGDPILNEKNWKKVSCKEIISKIGSGSTPLGGNKNYKSKGISFIRSLNVHNNKFINDGLVFIDEKQSEKLKNVNVEKDDILFNITGASVARSCIVPLNILPARVNQHVSIIRCNKEIIKPIFLCSQLTNIQYQSFLLKIAKNNGATREALTKEQLENLNIILPPIELQNKFADFVRQTEKCLFESYKSCKSLSFRLNYFNML